MRNFFIIVIIAFNNYCFANQLINILSHEESGVQKIDYIFDKSVMFSSIMLLGNDLVIDFESIDTKKTEYVFDGQYINKISVASNDSKLRVVLINGAKFKYLTENSGNIFSIFISSNSTNRDASIDGESKLNIFKIQDIKFERNDVGDGVVVIDYVGNGHIRFNDQRVGDKLALSLKNVILDSSLIRRMDVSDFASPIKYIDSIKSGRNETNINLINRNSWSYAVYQLQNRLVINIKSLSDKSVSVIPDIYQKKNNLITLNFQNIEIRALLQLLSEFSGYNILISDSVNGSISLKLNNVPWDQALQIVLNSNGLGMKRDGNVIHVAPLAELTAMNKAKQDSELISNSIEAIDSLTVRLKYAQAQTVQTMLQQGYSTTAANNQQNITHYGLVSLVPANGLPKTKDNDEVLSQSKPSLISPRGSILVDARTNTLIINDIPNHLKEIKELIDKIDIPVKQVLIEARIVQATNSFERNLGTRLFLAGLGNSFATANTTDNAAALISGGNKITNTIYNNSSKFINSDMGSYARGGVSAIYQPNSNIIIGLEIDAMELQSEGRTISSPKVITANYQTANIQQGVQIPYQQVSSAGNTNIAFVNATLSLQVTPQVTDDGNIMLNVNIQKNAPSIILVQSVPAIDTNSVNTQVMVQNGSTILVGGIYIDDQSVSVQQIPGLGDIPYLGWLFKAQKIKNEKKELLIFITPRVIENDLYDSK